MVVRPRDAIQQANAPMAGVPAPIPPMQPPLPDQPQQIPAPGPGAPVQPGPMTPIAGPPGAPGAMPMAQEGLQHPALRKRSKATIPGKLKSWIGKDNIADELDHDVLTALGQQVRDDLGVDEESRSEWRQTMDEVVDLACQRQKPKSFPWPDCANVLHPMIIVAALQFGSRAYPEFVRGERVADVRVIPDNSDKGLVDLAQRISTHLSWQLLEEVEGWEEDTDTLLHILPIFGLLWRKVSWDDSAKRPEIELVMPYDVVVNYWHPRGKYPERITHILNLPPSDIESYIRGGLWSDHDYLNADGEHADPQDSQATFKYLEQHTRYDLDEDGYPEPIIVTTRDCSNEVVRVTVNTDEYSAVVKKGKIVTLKPLQWWQDYHFLPAPDGSFYSLGFAILKHINDTVNTITNQLLDCGTWSSVPGGFTARTTNLAGQIVCAPGEFKSIDVAPGMLKDSIVPFPTKEPSPVLYQVLELLLNAAKELSTVSEEMTGQKQNANEPATSVLARIEQGMKLFTAIHKRIYRSIQGELRKVWDLNAEYCDDKDLKDLYNTPRMLVAPVANPDVASDMQRIAKAQAALQTVLQCGGDLKAAGKYVLEAMNVDCIDDLLPEGQAPQPDPEIMKIQANMQNEQAKRQVEADKHMMEMNAKAQEIQLDQQKAQMELINERELAQQKMDNEREMFELEMMMKAEEHEMEMRMKEAEMTMAFSTAKMAQDHEKEITDKQHGLEREKMEHESIVSMESQDKEHDFAREESENARDHEVEQGEVQREHESASEKRKLRHERTLAGGKESDEETESVEEAAPQLAGKILEALDGLTKRLGAEKRVVRDDEGNIVGVETVNTPD